MTGGATYREVLREHDARALIGASAASQLGDWLYNAALLAYVYSATGSAAWLAVATIARLLPYVLLGPFGGAVADRYPRRTVLLAGDLLRLAAMLMLAAVVALDGPVLVVIALTMLASAAGSAERPAAMALLPRLVGELRIGVANALLHTVQGVGIVVGPAIGALLLAIGPDYGPFLANGATFGVSAILIATIRRRDAPVVTAAGTASHIREGLHALREAPQAIWLMVVAGMVALTYGAQSVQLVVYANDVLDLGEGGYGLLLTAFGAGGVLSTTYSGRLASRAKVTAAVIGAAAITCASQLAFAGAEGVALALLLAVTTGAALVTCDVITETALVGLIPSDKLGRVMGVFDASSVAAMVAGALLAPVVLDATSLDVSFLALGGAALTVALASRAGLRGLDAGRERRLEALASRLTVLERMAVTRGAPRAVLEQLAAAAQEVALPAGVDVVVEGTPAHAYYAIVDGSVAVSRDGARRDTIGAGEGFGERGLLDNAPRNATVTTETDVNLLRIEGDALLEALATAPGLRSALDTSNRGPISQEPVPATAVVDDPRWAGT